MKEERYTYKVLNEIRKWEHGGGRISKKSYNGKMLNGECILYGINGNVSRFEVYEDGRLHGNFIDFYVK